MRLTRFRILDHAKEAAYGFVVVAMWAAVWLLVFFLALKVMV